MRAKGVPPVKYALPTKLKESQLRPAYAPVSKKISSMTSAFMKWKKFVVSYSLQQSLNNLIFRQTFFKINLLNYMYL